MTQSRDYGDTTLPAVGRISTRWGQERRLEFIDYRLRWDGQLNRSDLTAFFGISVPQASLDLSEYTKRAPDNLEYDTSVKIYKATSNFEPLFASTALERYLDDLIRAAVSPEIPYGSFLGSHPAVAVVPRPGRKLDTDVVITVVRAIREIQSLHVRYQSLSEPEPTMRELTPHALVSDGFRWHIRAYCHRRNEFRDFLLSRILEIRSGNVDKDRSQDDQQWHRVVSVVLAPHPGLEVSHRRVIESDYGMDNGECVLECRQALLFYVLQQLGLLDDLSHKSPAAQQIILKNREDLTEWLPRSKQR